MRSEWPLRRAALTAIAIVMAAAVLALLVVAARLKSGAVHRLDVTIDDDVNRYVHRHPAQIRMWQLISAIGGPLTWRILAGVTAVGLWFRRRRREAVLVAVAMAGAAVLSSLVKLLVDRARPVVPYPIEQVGGGSFPSGHALTSATALALLVLLAAPHLSTRWRATLVSLAAAVALAIGASRVMLGVHYVSDVVGAWLIAVLWLTVVFTFGRGH